MKEPLRHEYELVQCLPQCRQQLEEENGCANRSRCQRYPTWAALCEQVGAVAGTQPHDVDQRRVARGACDNSQQRLVQRLVGRAATPTSPVQRGSALCQRDVD
jgi:hypothetical protein